MNLSLSIFSELKRFAICLIFALSMVQRVAIETRMKDLGILK